MNEHSNKKRWEGDAILADAPDNELTKPTKAIVDEPLDLLLWDVYEADELIKSALAYPNEQYANAGKPGFGSMALDSCEKAVDEAYGAEDMGELRVAVRVFVVAGLKEFYRRPRAAYP